MGTSSKRSRKFNQVKRSNNETSQNDDNDFERNIESKSSGTGSGSGSFVQGVPTTAAASKPTGPDHQGVSKLDKRVSAASGLSWVYGIVVTLVLGIVIGMIVQAFVVPLFFHSSPDAKPTNVFEPLDADLSSSPPVHSQLNGVKNDKVEKSIESKPLVKEYAEQITEKQSVPDIGKESDPSVVRLDEKPPDSDDTVKMQQTEGKLDESIESISASATDKIESVTSKKATIPEEKKDEVPVIKTEKKPKTVEEVPSDVASKSVNEKAKNKNLKEGKSTAESSKDIKSEAFDIEKAVKDFKKTILNEFTPKKIFQDGRRIPPIELHHTKENNSTVRAYLFEEFFSKAECDGLMRAHDNHIAETGKQDPLVCFDSIKTLRSHLKELKKSKVKVTPKVFTEGTTCLNATFSTQFKEWSKSNWSYSTAFYPGESRFTSAFDQRVERSTGLKKEHGGKFQITSYPEGIGYKTHTDCRLTDDKRDRFATVLVYLQDVEEGGETKFPELGIWVKPKKGRALVWTNMNADGECDPLSVHYAAKVITGHKYILQRWYYYENFYSLGKRPPEPHLPPHNPGQPMVSCDEYENGSCRWYDEWSYDHVLDYRNQKAKLI